MTTRPEDKAEPIDADRARTGAGLWTRLFGFVRRAAPPPVETADGGGPDEQVMAALSVTPLREEVTRLRAENYRLLTENQSLRGHVTVLEQLVRVAKTATAVRERRRKAARRRTG